MESLVPALADWGVPPTDIHHEAFGPASAKVASSLQAESSQGVGLPLEVQFRRTGRTLRWEGRTESLLEFAERHGVALESGCRAGSCGSCETRLVSGEVRYLCSPDHVVAPGHCLLCVARPASALVLEA